MNWPLIGAGLSLTVGAIGIGAILWDARRTRRTARDLRVASIKRIQADVDEYVKSIALLDAQLEKFQRVVDACVGERPMKKIKLLADLEGITIAIDKCREAYERRMFDLILAKEMLDLIDNPPTEVR